MTQKIVQNDQSLEFLLSILYSDPPILSIILRLLCANIIYSLTEAARKWLVASDFHWLIICDYTNLIP